MGQRIPKIEQAREEKMEAEEIRKREERRKKKEKKSQEMDIGEHENFSLGLVNMLEETEDIHGERQEAQGRKPHLWGNPGEQTRHLKGLSQEYGRKAETEPANKNNKEPRETEPPEELK